MLLPQFSATRGGVAQDVLASMEDVVIQVVELRVEQAHDLYG